ncbi:MAG: hypothetical protein QOG80_2061 [Pseudonocardiales bacterium]|nr:hypothetical protein [Pseudonocardiales bacterium]
MPRRPAGVTTSDSAARELTAHAEFLEDRYGERWLDLPSALGRPLVEAESVLARGPVSIPPTLPANKAIVRARRAARAAIAIAKTARNESEILEHALGVSLVDLSLDQLSELVEAVLGLSIAPRSEPAWASPVAAHATDLFLDVCHDDLRESSQTHHAVYDHFTDHIWFVPVRRLQHGRHWWQPIARLRLRHALAVSSRTHKVPKPLTAAADLILEGHAVRNRLFAMAPLLATHLGVHDRGPVTDIDVVRESLNAVRALQRVLGDRLNPERLARLLVADAFKSDAVLEPATILSNALQAWNADVARHGGSHAGAMNGAELLEWASLTERALPLVEDAVLAVSAVDPDGGPVAPLRDVVYDLLVRERYNALIHSAAPSTATTTDAGTAS